MSSVTPSKRKLGSKHYCRPDPLEAPATVTPLSPPAAPPAKRLKPAPPSPPALGPPPPPSICEMEEDGPSVFDILNVFRCRWFLNRDHLLANILLAQKDDTGNIFWVDFLPPFHTHLVQRALALLPPLCPVAKGKQVMFMFLLEVIAGEGPKTFFDLPKKRMPRAWPQSPVTSGQAQVALHPATLPLAASPAPPPPPVALTPVAQLNRLDRPPMLGPPLPPKYQYDARKWAQKEQALADQIRLVGKWSPSCWVGASVMNFLVRDPPSCFLNAFASSLIDIDWVEAWVEQGISRCLDGALLWELAKEFAVNVECTVVPPGERPSPHGLLPPNPFASA